MDMRDQLPLWRQIKLALKEEIISGGLKPGDELASTASLAANYGVNIHTVRKALKELHEAGIVNVQNGRRAFVQDSRLDFAIGPVTRFTENVNRQGRVPQTQLVRSAKLAAPSRVRKCLGLDPGAEVVLLCTRGEADGLPVSFGRNYLPLSIVGHALSADNAPTTTIELLARAGVKETTRLGTVIISRMPTEEEATQLRQPRNQPVIVSEFVAVDVNGERVRYAQTAFAGARVQMVVGDGTIFEQDDGGSKAG